MIQGDNAFRHSDAWLLLALIYGRKPSDREQIIRIGDFIDHSIFNDDELEGGLKRLSEAGYVKQLDGGLYQPTPTVLEWFDRVSPKRSYVQKDRERVEEYLKVATNSEEAWLKEDWPLEERKNTNIIVAIEDNRLGDSLLFFLQKEGFLPRLSSPEGVYNMEPTFGPKGEAIFLLFTGGDNELLYDLAKHLHESWSPKGFVGCIALHPDVPKQEDIRKFWALNPVSDYDTPASFMVWYLSTLELQKSLPFFVKTFYSWIEVRKSSL